MANLKAAFLFSLVLASAMVMYTQAACDNETTFSNLSACNASVRTGGNGVASATCCSQLTAVGHECLCALLTGTPPSGVDSSLAAKLPAQCGLPGPDSCH